MWCQKCQADVAGLASPDNQRVLCTTCGLEIARTVPAKAAAPETAPVAPVPPVQLPATTVVHASVTRVPSPPVPSAIDQPQAEPTPANQPASEQRVTSPATAPAATPRALADPRELLARWAREDALNPMEFTAARDPAADSRKSLSRFDSSHPIAAPRPATLFEGVRAAVPAQSVAPTAAQRPPQPVADPPQQIGPGQIVHQAHALPPGPPHFQTAPVSLADKSSKWVTLVGQIFAYLGVGGLTVGTSLVLLGYFGGPASYVTTGWLVTTAGQMLLFLGVVTLVSGGMEQTTQEVARRIDTLGERLVRIEQAAERAEAKK